GRRLRRLSTLGRLPFTGLTFTGLTFTGFAFTGFAFTGFAFTGCAFTVLALTVLAFIGLARSGFCFARILSFIRLCLEWPLLVACFLGDLISDRLCLLPSVGLLGSALAETLNAVGPGRFRGRVDFLLCRDRPLQS